MVPAGKTSNFKSVTNGVSDPLLKAYKAGGFGLAVLTLGAILMLVAFFWSAPGPIRYIVLAIGAVLTFFTLAYVYLKEFPRIKQAQENMLASKEMVDTIQQSAIELTGLAYDLQSLAFKNASQVAEVLKAARPIIRNLPFVGGVADSEVMIKTDDLSSLIVSSTKKTKNMILALQNALIQGDVAYLKSLLADLHSYQAEIENMLSGKG